MEHTIELADGGPMIVVVSRPLRLPTVFVDGREIERRNDGGRTFWPVPVGGLEKRLFIRNSVTGLRADVDGTVLSLERRLAYWEVIVSLLPFGLVGLTIVGGLVGIAASTVNLRLMRRPWPATARVAATLVVFVVAAVVTLLIMRLAA